MVKSNLMMVVLQHLRVRPTTVRGAVHLYSAYVKGAWIYLFHREDFLTIGKYLRSDVNVIIDGLNVHVRRECEDLGYYLCSTKPWTTKWFKPKPGETVIDCGSSVGAFTLRAAQRGCTVYAFEPHPETVTVLARNVSANFLDKVSIFNLALGSREGVTFLYSAPSSRGTSSLNPNWLEGRAVQEKQAFRVRVVPLDLALKDINLKMVDWLLIDVESLELELLEGATDVLRRSKRIIIEAADGNREKVLGLLQKRGFREIDHGSKWDVIQYYFFERAS